MTHSSLGTTDALRPPATGRALAAVLAVLQEERERLLATVADLPEDDVNRRPPSGAWSVGEVLDHLHRVETGIARIVAGLISKAKAAGPLPPAPAESEEAVAAALASLDRFRIDTVVRPIEASEPVRPQGTHPKAELLDALGRSRAALLAAVAEGAGHDLAALRYPHRVLGDIDLQQWLLFAAKHERRHVTQIERVKAAITGPDAAASGPGSA